MEAILNKKKLRQEALKNGLIWGAINVVLFLVVWYAAPSLMSSFAYMGINFVVGIVLAIYFCIDLRKKAGGYWSFNDALWPIVGMFLMNFTIVFAFNLLFSKVIDPSYPVKMKELAIESQQKLFESFNMDESAKEEAMAKAEERLDSQFNPNFGQAVLGYGTTAIFYFIGALLFALIFKKNNPNPWVLDEEESKPLD